ncbi:hypothetical protein [Demequina soli]|uniref:hypothetical protein n=1 Tax=Demequina soli TaxID=1638987 RepID=UPI0007862FB2|nr:hypothetical protein [Demequina soli]
MSNPYAQSVEYARFGPWIDAVAHHDDVPRLFRDHPVDLAAARLVLKVPRNIPRRDATPDMDLYDHLLVVDDAGLTVLSRDGHDADRRRPAPPRGFTADRIALADIVALEDSVNLLRGRYRIHTRDGGGVGFAFSGSARASLALLTDALRATFPTRDDARPAGPAGLALAAATAGLTADLRPLDAAGDLALTADIRDVVAARPTVAAWACHPRRVLAPTGDGPRGLVRRIGHAWSPMVLQGAIVAGDGAALEILGRHEPLTRGNAPVHSASRLTMALSRLDAIAMTDLAGYAGADVATLTAGGWHARLPVPHGSSTLELLAAARPR